MREELTWALLALTTFFFSPYFYILVDVTFSENTFGNDDYTKKKIIKKQRQILNACLREPTGRLRFLVSSLDLWFSTFFCPWMKTNAKSELNLCLNQPLHHSGVKYKANLCSSRRGQSLSGRKRLCDKHWVTYLITKLSNQTWTLDSKIQRLNLCADQLLQPSLDNGWAGIWVWSDYVSNTYMKRLNNLLTAVYSFKACRQRRALPLTDLHMFALLEISWFFCQTKQRKTDLLSQSREVKFTGGPTITNSLIQFRCSCYCSRWHSRVSFR